MHEKFASWRIFGSIQLYMQNVPPKDAFSKIKDGGALVIDVRTPAEYTEARIAGSVNVDVSASDFFEKISALDKSKEYIVYCRSGGRSSAAQGIMTRAGFKDVCNLYGGITAWSKDGLPVEQ